MSVALRLYEQLTEAPDEKTKARLIAEAFEQLEERYPHLKEVATQSHIRESELRLQKEIREVEVKIKEVEVRLQKEIREVEVKIKEVEARLQIEIREVEAKLQKEIREVEAKLAAEIKSVDAALRIDIKNVEVKVAETKAELIRWVVAVSILQTTLLTGVLLKIAHLI